MKITANSPERLALRHVPWIPVIAIAALVFLLLAMFFDTVLPALIAGEAQFGDLIPIVGGLAVCLGAGAAFFHPFKITLDAATGEMRALRLTLFRRHAMRVPLAEIGRVYVRAYGGSDEEAPKYTLMVRLTSGDMQGDHPLTRPSDGARLGQVEAAMNDWLARHRDTAG